MAGFLPAIAQAFRRCWDFDGRATRSEFWFYFLFAELCAWSLIMLTVVTRAKALGVVTLIVNTVLLFPMCSVCTRRLHDSGLALGWRRLALLPILGWLILAVLLCRPSYMGVNRYGSWESATEQQIARRLYERRRKDGGRAHTIADIAARLGVSRATAFSYLDPDQQRQVRVERDAS
ncbi:DUF805 domain-containing protein [Actinomadura terrae]|uniref:DUF805 domain-containing protein n=1 Tax=Actinomadura terrae TaxID=604353 RepID=UPI001FA7B766|nr:DUF805 domain-containing protein [Actinomadura terrae]